MTSKVGFVEYEMSEEMATELNISNCLEVYLREKDFFYSPSSSFLKYVRTYLFENPSCKLQKLCNKKKCTKLSLYGLDLSIKYEENSGMLSREDYSKVWDEIDKLYLNYTQELGAIAKRKKEDAKKLILTYVKKYNAAPTKTMKSEIVNEIKFRLNDEYGLDGRSDRIASTSGVRCILETTQV